MDFDPQPVFAQVRVPTLAFYGEADSWTPVAASIEAWRQARGDEVEIVVVPGAEHDLTLPDGTLSPVYERTLVDWLSRPLRGLTRGRYPGRVAPLDALSPRTRKWFERAFEGPTPAQALGWPAIAEGGHVLIQAPTGSGKTLAAFLLGLDRLNETPGEGLRLLYVSPLKALNYDIERNLRSPLAGLDSKLAVGVRTGDTPAEERRRMLRTPPDILITTPESLFLLLTSQARETLRGVETVILDEVHAVAGTKRGSHLALSLERLERLVETPFQRVGLSATQRPMEEIGRFVAGHRARDPARRRGRSQGARPAGRRPRRGHARASVDLRALGAAARGRRRDGRRRRAVEPLDLAVDLPRDPRARPGAPLDDRLREQPAPRRAARAADQRARRRGARARPSRLARARAAARRRGAPQGGRDPVSRRDVVARARHRHGRRRPRDPGREPEVGRARPAARRPRRPRPALDLEGAHLPEVPRRSPRVGRGRARDACRRHRGDAHPAEPARRARAADRRDLRRGGGLGRRAPRARAARVSVRGALARAARERPRHARRPLSVRRVRRAAAEDRLGSNGRHRARALRGAAARGHERGDDSRPRPVRRLPRRRRWPRGRARRGDGVRGARGPDVPARRVDLADRGDHAGSRARLAGPGSPRCGAVLEGRGHRPPCRARGEDRQDLARALGALRRRSARAGRERTTGSTRSRRATS